MKNKNKFRYTLEIILSAIAALLLSFCLVRSIAIDNTTTSSEELKPIVYVLKDDEMSFINEFNDNKAKFVYDYRRLRFNNLPCIYDNVENPTKFEIEYPLIVE